MQVVQPAGEEVRGCGDLPPREKIGTDSRVGPAPSFRAQAWHACAVDGAVALACFGASALCTLYVAWSVSTFRSQATGVLPQLGKDVLGGNAAHRPRLLHASVSVIPSHATTLACFMKVVTSPSTASTNARRRLAHGFCRCGDEDTRIDGHGCGQWGWEGEQSKKQARRRRSIVDG